MATLKEEESEGEEAFIKEGKEERLSNLKGKKCEEKRL